MTGATRSRLSRRALGLVVALSGAAAAILVAAACVGDDPPITTEARDDGRADAGALSPDAMPSLNCPLACLPGAPDGWTGPSAVYDGPPEGKPAACPTGYTIRELEAHQGLTAPPASCECAGGQVQGAKCEVKVVKYAGQCSSPSSTTYEIPDAGCINTASPAFARIEAPVLVLDAATCSFPPATKTLPPAVFEKVNLACGLTQLAPCPERADCVSTPAPEFGRLCIHKHGDELCPSRDYPVRFVAYADIREERDCAPCSGSPRGGNCGDASTFRFMTPNCASLATGERRFDECFDPPASDSHVDLSGHAPTDVDCPTHQGEAIGTATSDDPVTFCCTR